MQRCTVWFCWTAWFRCAAISHGAKPRIPGVCTLGIHHLQPVFAPFGFGQPRGSTRPTAARHDPPHRLSQMGEFPSTRLLASIVVLERCRLTHAHLRNLHCSSTGQMENNAWMCLMFNLYGVLARRRLYTTLRSNSAWQNRFNMLVDRGSMDNPTSFDIPGGMCTCIKPTSRRTPS